MAINCVIDSGAGYVGVMGFIRIAILRVRFAVCSICQFGTTLGQWDGVQRFLSRSLFGSNLGFIRGLLTVLFPVYWGLFGVGVYRKIGVLGHRVLGLFLGKAGARTIDGKHVGFGNFGQGVPLLLYARYVSYARVIGTIHGLGGGCTCILARYSGRFSRTFDLLLFFYERIWSASFDGAIGRGYGLNTGLFFGVLGKVVNVLCGVVRGEYHS